VCHKETLHPALRYITLVLATVCLAEAQAGAPWRRVGSSAVELMLASPATGPVDRVWFSGDGSLLYARTRSGKVFETVDFEIWTPSGAVIEPTDPPAALSAAPAPQVARLPEPGARVIAGNFGRTYALGRQLYRSEDGGRSWVDLTGFKDDSVIGPGQRSVAVSPFNPDQLVVANNFGVWRSMDGGLSWAGLNQFLPNLGVRRILAAGTTGTRVDVDGMGVLELPPGGGVWLPSQGNRESEAARLQYYSAKVGAEARSFAVSGRFVYVGTSDGQIWVSTDDGVTFNLPTARASGPVERIFVDAAQPRVALAALGGPNAPHVLRTTNGGAFWDPLDSNLPNAPAHGVTGERASGAVYVATDKGVFWARVDLDAASTMPVSWSNLSDRLPPAGATDVRLDASGIQLYAALDGYGVYATAAPHRMKNLRVVNAADFSTRAAAPGSLLSVIGARVNSARGGNLDYPVLAAADDGSQIQVPFDATGPNVTLALMTVNGRVQVGMQVHPVSPAIFVARDGSPMLQDAESGLLLDARNAARSNAHIQVFATGLGRVRPDWPTGQQAPLENPPVVAASVRAYLNGAPVPVTKATLAPGYIGFYLIELQLPAINNAGLAELYISADGSESNHVQILIEQ
jgi:uncharacterized protein (TIGR03437 family)